MYTSAAFAQLKHLVGEKIKLTLKFETVLYFFCLMLAHCEWSHLMTKMFLSAIVTKKPSKRDVPFIREIGEMEQSAFLGLEEGL